MQDIEKAEPSRKTVRSVTAKSLEYFKQEFLLTKILEPSGNLLKTTSFCAFIIVPDSELFKKTAVTENTTSNTAATAIANFRLMLIIFFSFNFKINNRLIYDIENFFF